MNILIVDDNPSNLKLLRAVLEAEGITVCEASDGFEAIGVLLRGRVDAIISDILMPRMDGYRLCMEVRSNHRFCDLPFIAYTATYTSDRDEKLMTDLGADCFLRKPTSAAVLTATLDDVVRSKRRRPPTPARVQPEPHLLTKYNERLVAKLDEKIRERGTADLAPAEPTRPAERKLTDTAPQLRRWFEHSPAMLYGAKWENEKVVPCLISESFSQLLGFSAAETTSYDWWLGQLHPDDRFAAIASLFETVAQGHSCTVYRLRHRDGSIRWVEDRRRCIHDVSGQPVELTGAWTDITGRKEAEATQLQLREQWRKLGAIATAAMVDAQEGGIALANAEAARIIAATSSEDLMVRGHRDFARDDYGLRLATIARQIRLLNGSPRAAAANGHRAEEGFVEIEPSTAHPEVPAPPASSFPDDLSEPKPSPPWLSLQAAVTVALAETASTAEITRKILAALAAGLGWDFADLWMIDRGARVLRCTEIWHRPSAEFREFAAESRNLVFSSGQGLPGRVWASDRTEWCSNRVNPAGLQEWIGFPIKLRQEVVGVVGFFSQNAIRRDADLLAFFDTLGLQLGQFVERQQLSDQLRQAQKMEAIGTLAGGIAHDFNNILGAIYGYCELAQMEAGNNRALTGHLEAVMGGARRATDLVGQILAFSRQQGQERRPIQLREVTAETMRLLRAAVPATIEFEIALENSAPVVLANATQVHQILMNLGTNAAHAMRGHGGRLTVKLERFDVGPELAAVQPELHVGRYARLTVSDTGQGMDAETLGRVFEPLFTTKPSGEGTGLGLTVVRGIVKLHEGAITVSSRRGEGTTFHVYFPAHLTEADEVVAASASLPRGAGERILFVDDETALADVGRLVLDHIGYATDTCSNALQAIDLVSANPAAYALVITDQMMPGMTGVDLSQRLNAIRPDLPIILTTGCTDMLLPDRLRAVGIRQLLAKPLSVQALAEAVRHVLSPAVPAS